MSDEFEHKPADARINHVVLRCNNVVRAVSDDEYEDEPVDSRVEPTLQMLNNASDVVNLSQARGRRRQTSRHLADNVQRGTRSAAAESPRARGTARLTKPGPQGRPHSLLAPGVLLHAIQQQERWSVWLTRRGPNKWEIRWGFYRPHVMMRLRVGGR